MNLENEATAPRAARQRRVQAAAEPTTRVARHRVLGGRARGGTATMESTSIGERQCVRIPSTCPAPVRYTCAHEHADYMHARTHA